MGILQRTIFASRNQEIQFQKKIKFNMSISDWSSYTGKPSEVEWPKEDFLAYIQEDENLSETSSKGWNLMHVAAIKGWQDIVEELNEEDSSMKDGQADNGVTPVMSACYKKKTGIAKYLL